MTKIVNVRFRDAGKTYRFTCDGYSLSIGDAVMCDTTLGVDLAHVIEQPYESDGEINPDEVVPILRLATPAEIKQYEDKCVKEKDAYFKCNELIEKHQLNMNLVDVVFAFDSRKIVFFFTSDNRVDFRELVKDLASVFRARIELRQIGSRDQARLVGGLGVCGRELCCCTFLSHFTPVTLKLAREQGLSLNPTKLNGACGRLMCCLQFESEAYKDANARLPDVGKRIRTNHGVGVVTDVDLLQEIISVKLTTDDETQIEKFPWTELEPLNPELHKKGKNCDNCECPAGGNKESGRKGVVRDSDYNGRDGFEEE